MSRAPDEDGREAADEDGHEAAEERSSDQRRPTAGGLDGEFRALVRERGWFDGGEPVVVAVSGGVDSLVLLHLLHSALRGEGGPGAPPLVPAHLDHAMRPESAAHADRLERMLDAWGLPLRRGRADPPPTSETGARQVRHAFLRRVRRDTGARWIALGHHADDQRETVLFRILRGTGIRGLAGIREETGDDLLRPLLSWDRARVLSHARQAALTPIEDPTNELTTPARNRIRHELLPLAERVHPGAPNALLRLARRAREHDRALRALMAPHLERVLLDEPVRDRFPVGPDPTQSVAISRDELLAYSEPVRAELLRAAAERAGVRLTESGTASAMEFIRRGSSGGRIELPGSAVLVREFDVLRFRPAADAERRGLDAAAVLSGEQGSTTLRLGDCRYRVRWAVGGDAAAEPPEHDGAHTEFRDPELRRPLEVRGRLPGDRVRTRQGSRALKRVLREVRVPRDERATLPLLVDGEGLVLWIPGRWRAPLARPDDLSETWTIGVTHVRHSA